MFYLWRPPAGEDPTTTRHLPGADIIPGLDGWILINGRVSSVPVGAIPVKEVLAWLEWRMTLGPR